MFIDNLEVFRKAQAHNLKDLIKVMALGLCLLEDRVDQYWQSWLLSQIAGNIIPGRTDRSTCTVGRCRMLRITYSYSSSAIVAQSHY